MCAITGYLYLNKTKTETANLLKMLRLMAHRGPDDEGLAFVNTNNQKLQNFCGEQSNVELKNSLPQIEHNSSYEHNLALGHRRYSIIDLTAEGHQPMLMHGNLLSFNGEIYNYIELRQELETKHNITFNTKTDTEVIAAAYKVWKQKCFKHFNGFFAIVMYDIAKNQLIFARDRIGKAPLYYTICNGMIVWASEIKPIFVKCPEIRNHINFESVGNYLDMGIRDFNNSTFWGPITTFPAANYSIVDLSQPNTVKSITPTPYWQFPSQRLQTKDISIQDAANGLINHLQKALDIRLRSDIPVAFTLSGGMDSSTLAALFAERQEKSADFLCVKYDNPSLDESGFAQQVANRYPKYIKLRIIDGMENNLIDDLKNYTRLIEEPYHSPVLYTDFNLQKILKNLGYGVMLNGGGGDELLAGYEYEYYPSFIKYLSKNSKLTLIDELTHANSFPGVKRALKAFLSIYGVSFPKKNLPSFTNTKTKIDIVPSQNFSELCIQNFTSYKMNYWMRSGNKSYMGVPMEPRMPFLDYNVIDFAFTLPPEYLIHHGWHKYILRIGMMNKLPKEIVWRAVKVGYPFDHSFWLKKYKSILIKQTETIKLEFINSKELFSSYDILATTYPILLWRYLSLLLWYKYLIEEQN